VIIFKGMVGSFSQTLFVLLVETLTATSW